MSASGGVYDVWLTASNRVYKAVPFDVVTDWLQQGRLLPDDRVRDAGGVTWETIIQCAALSPFLPRATPDHVDDRAEALEVVALDVPIRRRESDEDDDVDMIPLIDISLVLLIFFMMTATIAVSGASIDTPQTYHGVQLTADATQLWVGIDRSEDGKPVYSLGVGDQPAAEGDGALGLAALLTKLDQKLAASGRGVSVRVAGHRRLPFGVVQELTGELEKRRQTGRILDIKAEVNEKSS